MPVRLNTPANIRWLAQLQVLPELNLVNYLT
jgi:hypothetical protein